MSPEIDSTPQGGEPAQVLSNAVQQDVKPSTESSPAQTQDVKPQADSSPATGDKKEAPTLRDKIQEGIEKIRKGAEKKDSPPEVTEQIKDQKSEQTDDAEDPVSEAEKTAPVDLKNHPVFKQVLSERKQARKERNKALKELETYKVDATNHRRVQQFLQENSVSSKDAAEALKLAALAYNDPQKFFTQLKGMYEMWSQHLGMQLSPDLQQKVQDGYISQDDAEALSRAQAERDLVKAQNQKMQERVHETDTQKEIQFRTRLFEDWAGQTSKTDPDLPKKLTLIAGRLRDIAASEGDPSSADDAWNRLSRAHKEVTESIRQFQQPRQPIQASPTSTGATRAPMSSPKNFEEAMAASINKVLRHA